jgi:tungstate transport system substrate-binding protein
MTPPPFRPSRALPPASRCWPACRRGPAAQEFITVASTTSTENSGLFGHILPIFTAETGIEVRVVAQGTGQALETGRRGDADVVFVHARAQEEAVRRRGLRRAALRRDVQRLRHRRPRRRPGRAARADTAAAAMAAIAAAGGAFASRGDDSGTHVAEMALWEAAGIAPAGGWYLSTGSGMGATLNTAAQVPAYALTDRGTWLASPTAARSRSCSRATRCCSTPTASSS